MINSCLGCDIGFMLAENAVGSQMRLPVATMIRAKINPNQGVCLDSPVSVVLCGYGSEVCDTGKRQQILGDPYR